MTPQEKFFCWFFGVGFLFPIVVLSLGMFMQIIIGIFE